DYIAAYLRHKSQERYQDFCLHAARYFSMYLSDAGYEVGMTARYKSAGGQPEACVIATRPFTAGSIINLCSGSIARLDEGDLARLEREKADFSVMWWSKKRHMCLFLGPARFVNHDCDSNCRFTALGSDAICFQVLKNIKPGQEITTHYGHNYFGANNCECLCASCEKYGRGGFAKGPVSPSRNGIIKDQPGSPPRIRTRNHGRRRVLNSGEPCCRTCKEPLSAYESIIATTSGGGRSGDARECPRCERHFVIFGLPWPDRPEIQARRKKPAAKGNPGSAPGRSSSSSLRKRKLQAQRPDEFATSIYND
ncbi:histone lysine methyltransferase Set9, partial [Spiromyces aspiralis]